MNSLSILIYVISLIESVTAPLSTFIGIGWFFLVVSTVAMLISTIIVRSFAQSGDHDAKAWMESGFLSVKKVWKASLTVVIVCTLIFIVIPDKKYAVMIAASEIGERVLQTDAAQKFGQDVTGLSQDATDLLKAYMQQQTDEIRKQMADQVKALADKPAPVADTKK